MITSPSNGKIKYVKELLAKSRFRRKEKRFVSEGVKMFLEAPEEDIEEVYISERLNNRFRHEEDLPEKYIACRERLNDYPFEVVADAVFEKMSDTVTPQGILTVIHRKKYHLEDLLYVGELRRIRGVDFQTGKGKPAAALYIVLENLQDPGNVGTILRTAEAAGVDGVILGENCVDVYNPKVIRSTMGAIYRVPYTYVENVKEAIREMKEANITTYAATLAPDSASYDSVDYRGATAFLIGNEGNGLTKEAIEVAGESVYIPMEGNAESLNASMAAGILMYEAVRQRRSR